MADGAAAVQAATAAELRVSDHTDKAKALAQEAEAAFNSGDRDHGNHLLQQAEEEKQNADYAAAEAEEAGNLAAYHFKDDTHKNWGQAARARAQEAHDAVIKARSAS